MLMLRHVYRSSPRLLEDVLRSLLEDEDIEIGPRFEQQVGGTHSVPDAVLSQKPLHIYVEAKRGDWLTDDQMEGHVRSIIDMAHPKNSAFLITLTNNREDGGRHWHSLAARAGIAIVATTYRDLVGALEKACASDTDLLEIFDDYRTFIGQENLLPDQYRKLVAVLCGQSWRENIKFGVYFEPAHRNPKWTQAHFLGVYHEKCISHVGRLEMAAVCLMRDGQLIVEAEEFGTLRSDHKDRIRNAMRASESYFGGFSSDAHRYYIVERFVETEIRKLSSGGMMGHRYFDIARLAKNEQVAINLTSEEAATILKGKTFE